MELKGDMGGHEDFALIGDYRGGEGYLAQAKLRSLIDYRLIAKLVAGNGGSLLLWRAIDTFKFSNVPSRTKQHPVSIKVNLRRGNE